jgi:hypothetical protein
MARARARIPRAVLFERATVAAAAAASALAEHRANFGTA